MSTYIDVRYKKEISEYEENLREALILPINEDEETDIFYPWKCKSVYVQEQKDKNDEGCFF